MPDILRIVFLASFIGGLLLAVFAMLHGVEHARTNRSKAPSAFFNLPAIAAFAVVLTACGGGTAPARTATAKVTDLDRVGQAGVTVALPVGWSEAPRSRTSVTDPVRRVVVSSTPARINPDPGSCTTEASERVFAPAGAMVLVMEYTSQIGGPIANCSARPERFGGAGARPDARRLPAGGFECLTGPGWVFMFADLGRRFPAWLVLGPEAKAAVKAEALAVLTTLTVDPVP